MERFRRGERPFETFENGLVNVQMLMALYRSAELGPTVLFADEDLERSVPLVARG